MGLQSETSIIRKRRICSELVTVDGLENGWEVGQTVGCPEGCRVGWRVG